jgi:hypothetical protein
MSLLGKLSSTEGANDRNGNPAPTVTRQALQGAFKTMTFHNLNTQGSPLLSHLWHLTEPDLYEAAKKRYGNTSLLEDLGSGFAAELFGRTVYFTSSVNTMDVNTMASNLLHEALHLLGYSEARIKESFSMSQLEDTCIKPLGIVP